MLNILLVNTTPQQCGVYQFGRTIGSLLKGFYGFNYIEVVNFREVEEFIKDCNSDFIVYNHHPSTELRWLSQPLAAKYPSALLVHDFAESWEGVANIFPDPTYQENGKNFRINRPIPIFNKTVEEIPNSVGSFGFGFDHKGLDGIISMARCFDDPIVRFHIPHNTVVDRGGVYTRKITEFCLEKARDWKIRIEVNHNYLSSDELLIWLAQNSINVFNYRGHVSQGVSSATDWAIAVKKPIAISDSHMFRHLHCCKPSIINTNRPLNEIRDSGFEPIEKITNKWTRENLYRELQRIANDFIFRSEK